MIPLLLILIVPLLLILRITTPLLLTLVAGSRDQQRVGALSRIYDRVQGGVVTASMLLVLVSD